MAAAAAVTVAVATVAAATVAEGSNAPVRESERL